MNKNCKNCQEQFEITEEDLKFYDKVSPVFNGEKYLIPPPTFCPDCRQQRRLTFRNERNLYHRKCDMTGKQIISIYSSDKPYKVYNQKEWWSDKWDATDCGKDFDFNRPFFEQLDELIRNAVLVSLFGRNNENSDYVNQETDNKNGYLNFGGHYNEDCYYNTYSIKGKNNIDNYWVLNSELMYQSVDCEKCYKCFFSQDLQECNECHFSKNLTGCKNCFGCYGLRHKEFYFNNSPLQKEDYYKKTNEILSSQEKVSSFRKEIKKSFLKYPHKYIRSTSCENTSGDYIKYVKDSKNAFDIERIQDCKNVYIGLDMRDCMDTTSYGWGELNYEVASAIELNNVLFSSSVVNIDNSMYCFVCFNSNNLFGCVGMKGAKYCILNKQYTKEEYEKLVPKIIEHMKSTGEFGEFFPASISPFGYNETVAQEYFPLNKEQAKSECYKWKEEDTSSKYQGVKYQIPQNIEDVQDDITNAILECKVSHRPYKIIPQELKFYRKMKLPIPHLCPEQRHKERMALRNPRKLWDRKCMKCGKDIKTTYSPDRKEIVYCEECYLKEVY